MKIHPVLLIFLVGLPASVAAANAADQAATSSAERLGSVSFSVSCAPAVEAQSTRPEFDHVKAIVSSARLAVK